MNEFMNDVQMNVKRNISGSIAPRVLPKSKRLRAQEIASRKVSALLLPEPMWNAIPITSGPLPKQSQLDASQWRDHNRISCLISFQPLCHRWRFDSEA